MKESVEKLDRTKERVNRMKPEAWRICLIQMDVSIGEPDRNADRVKRRIEQVMDSPGARPDVIVLPEMWNTGYALEKLDQLADPGGEAARELLSALSARYGVNIIGGSVSVREGSRFYNRLYVTDRQGRIAAQYDKTHLFRLMDEHSYLTAGDLLGRFELDGVACGAIICYDLRFPELARTLALDGAEVLFVPAQWPHPRLHHWRTLLTARAIENQMFIAACNRVGTSVGADGTASAFFGHSVVLDPWGETIAGAEEEETDIYADIPLSSVQEVRSRIPVFADRREALYRGIGQPVSAEERA